MPDLDLRNVVAQVVEGRCTVDDALAAIEAHAGDYVAHGEDHEARPVREVRARWIRLRDEIAARLADVSRMVSPLRVAHEGRLLIAAADLLGGELSGAAAAIIASRLGELEVPDEEITFLTIALGRFPGGSPDARRIMRARVQRLGAAHRSDEAIAAATAYHDAAMASGATADQAEALLLRSVALVANHETGRALEDVRSAVRIRETATELPDWVSRLSDYLLESGRQERNAGRVEAAFLAFDRGQQVARDHEDDEARALVHLSEIGITWEVVGDVERSATLLNDAVARALTAGYPELAARWGGSSTTAGPEPSDGAALLGHLARLLAAPSRDLAYIRKRTLELIRRAVLGGGRELEMQARNLLGRVYTADGRWAQAEAALLEARSMAEELDLRLMSFHLWTNLGNLYLQWGRRDRAEHALREAAVIGERVRDEAQGTELRQSLGAGLARCYQQLAFWAHTSFVPSDTNIPQPPDPAAAFDIGARSRAYNFNAWLRISLLLDQTSDLATREAVASLRQVEVEIEAASDASSVLPPTMITRRQQAHEACRALGLDALALARVPDEARSLRRWQRELLSGELAVVLCSLPEGIGVTTITSGCAECRFLPFPRAQRLRLLAELREASSQFVEHDDGDARGAGWQTARAAQAMLGDLQQRLHDKIFAPIAAMASPAGTVERLLVVPHDELFLVPWCRLQDAVGACRWSCLPSTESLTLLWQRRRHGGLPWLAFGDATGELGGASREVGALQGFRVRTPVRQDVLTTLHDAGIVHFAGHGWHNGSNEYLGGLVMRDPVHGERDDLLTVADVSARLTMRAARLVVLSACDSGQPRVHPASEFTSLPGAFLVAGARNVVASLWPAHDVAASLFMRAFYDALDPAAGAQGSVSGALATARRALATLSYEAAVLASDDAGFIPRRPRPFDHPAYLDTFQHYGVD